MPQNQVLPGSPGFGALLGQALGQGVSQGLSSSLNAHLERKKQESQVISLLNILGIDPETKDLPPVDPNSNQPSASGTDSSIPNKPQANPARPPQKGKITPAHLAVAAVKGKPTLDLVTTLYNQQEEPRKQGIKSEIDRSSLYLSGIDKIREGLPAKELAIKQIGQAIENRTNLEAMSDLLADYIGIDKLRSMNSGQITAASKQFLLADVSKLTGKTNLFLDKAVGSALTDQANSKLRNQVITTVMKSNLELDRAKVDLTSKLEDYYKETQGWVPAKISKEVDEQLKPIAEKIEEERTYKVREIIEKKMSDAELSKLKKVDEGTPLTERMANILFDKYGEDPEEVERIAKKLGYTIPGS